MKLAQVNILRLFIFLSLAALARADVIVNNLNQPTQNLAGPIGSDSNSNDFLLGQEFALPSGPNPYQLNKVTLLLSPTGGGAHITASLWSVGPDGNPSNEVASISSQLVTTAGIVDFVPSTNIVLAPGNYYVVAAPTTVADSGFVDWAYAATTNWTGTGALENIAATMAGFWQNASITNLPQQMSVEATPMTAAIGIHVRGGITTLFWLSALNGYVVDTKTNLAARGWQAVTNVPTLVAGTNTVTNRWTDPVRFFHLRQSLAVDNLEQTQVNWDGPLGTDNNNQDFLIAQEFTLPTGTNVLNKATLALNPANGSAHITVSIWTASTNNTPGTEIAVVSSQLVTTAGKVDFVPATTIVLPAGTYYVMAAPTAPADNAKVGWYWTASTVWTGFGILDGFADTFSGSWQSVAISTGPFQISVQVTPAP